MASNFHRGTALTCAVRNSDSESHESQHFFASGRLLLESFRRFGREKQVEALEFISMTTFHFLVLFVVSESLRNDTKKRLIFNLIGIGTSYDVSWCRLTLQGAPHHSVTLGLELIHIRV